MKRRKEYDPTNRNHMINVRMTDEEYTLLMEQVEKTELTLSEYVRDMVLTGEVKVTVKPVLNTEKLDQIIYESARIGNNINQIAKHLNEGNPFTSKLTKHLHHELAALAAVRADIEKLEEGF